MDAAAILTQLASLPPALPKFHALVDYGRGLYAGFDTHTQTLAETIARTRQARLHISAPSRSGRRTHPTAGTQIMMDYLDRLDLQDHEMAEPPLCCCLEYSGDNPACHLHNPSEKPTTDEELIF